MEDELALNDEEFEKRLLDRLKKEIEAEREKYEEGLRKEFAEKEKLQYGEKMKSLLLASSELEKENEKLEQDIEQLKYLLLG